jgi:1-acyl-sn-glycerol-3-phosphate acyltransferase
METEASQTLADDTGWLRRIAGVVATITALLLTSVLGVAAAVGSFIAEGHGTSPVMSLWAWSLLRVCGVKVEVSGLENLDGLDSFVLVANHQSLFDVLATIWAIPRELRFVAKRELRRIPVIGFAMERSGHIIVDRQRGGQAIRRAIEVTRKGYSICVFGEGHRYSDNRVHEFNDGAAWLAIATRMPCVPAAISGSLAIMPRGARFVVPGRKIRIVLGRPIPTVGLKSADRADLTRRLEDEVRAAFRTTV